MDSVRSTQRSFLSTIHSSPVEAARGSGIEVTTSPIASINIDTPAVESLPMEVVKSPVFFAGVTSSTKSGPFCVRATYPSFS